MFESIYLYSGWFIQITVPVIAPANTINFQIQIGMKTIQKLHCMSPSNLNSSKTVKANADEYTKNLLRKKKKVESSGFEENYNRTPKEPGR